MLISLAFLQEYFFDIKKQYRNKSLKYKPLHFAISVLGMAAAAWGLFGKNLYWERYVVIVVVCFGCYLEPKIADDSLASGTVGYCSDPASMAGESLQ